MTKKPEYPAASTSWRSAVLTFFGVLTLATFFAPGAWSHDFAGPFNVARIVVMLCFISLFFTFRIDHDFVGVLARPSRGARVLMAVVPLLVLALTIIQAGWREFGVWLIRSETWDWNYRHGIFVKAACDLAACVIFVTLAVTFARRRHGGRQSRSQALLASLLSCVFAFVTLAMAGEELSWGQRIFRWETPAGFVNDQGETNLHNFATEVFQNVWYFGCWLLLVAMPFFHVALTRLSTRFKRFRFLSDFWPPTYFFLVFASAYGLVDPFDSFAGISYGSILFSILATFALLVYLTVWERGRMAKWTALPLVVFLVVLWLELFVVRTWDINMGVPTEYLEVFISFGVLAWAIVLRRRVSACG